MKKDIKKMNEFSFNWLDVPGNYMMKGATYTKEKLDSRGSEIKTFLNEFIDILNGEEAAEFLGAKNKEGIKVSIQELLLEIDNDNTLNQEVIDRINTRYEALKEIFDDLIINAGNENAEIVAARTNEKGQNFPTLGDRLNNNDIVVNNVNTELVDSKKCTINYNGIIRSFENIGYTLYVTTDDVNITGNDGTDISKPIKLTHIPIILNAMSLKFGVLKGQWRIKIKEGIYTPQDINTHMLFLKNIRTDNYIIFEGKEVLKTEIPLTVIDGLINGVAYTHGFFIQNMNIIVKNIKFINFTEGTDHRVPTGSRAGLAISGKTGELYAINVHAHNCSWGGIINQSTPKLLVEGGKFENCRFGINSAFNTTVTIGYRGSNTQQEAEKPHFINCSEGGVGVQSQTNGHVDYSVFRNCTVGVFLATNSEINGVENVFDSNSNAIWSESSSRFLNGNNKFINNEKEYVTYYGGIVQETTDFTDFRRRSNVESPNPGSTNLFVSSLTATGILYEKEILFRDIKGRGKMVMFDLYGRINITQASGCTIKITIEDINRTEQVIDTIIPNVPLNVFNHFKQRIVLTNFAPNNYYYNGDLQCSNNSFVHINSVAGINIAECDVVSIKIKCELKTGSKIDGYRLIPMCIL